MKALFLKKQVWGAITGYDNEEKMKDHRKRSREEGRERTKSLWGSSSSISVIPSWMTSIAVTSREAWDNLKAVCTTYTMHDQIQFLGELIDFRKPDSMTM